MRIDHFDGRVAFVTGGARGIGLGIARALAKVHVKIAIVDVNAHHHIGGGRRSAGRCRRPGGVSLLCPGPVATGILRHTAEMRPAGDPASTAVKEAAAAAEPYLAAGTHPDAVGEMVLDAMRAGRLHIYTDNMMEELIKRRTQRLLAALPSALAR